MIVQRQNSAYDRTDSLSLTPKAALPLFLLYRCPSKESKHLKKIRQCFGAVPAVISVAAGVMLVCLLLVVMAGENALSSAYKGQSFVSSLILGRMPPRSDIFPRKSTHPA